MSRISSFAITFLALHVLEAFVIYPAEKNVEILETEAEAKSPYCLSGYCRFPNRCCPGYVCRFNLFAPYFQGICVRKVNFHDPLGTGHNKTTEEQQQPIVLVVPIQTAVSSGSPAVVVIGSAGTANSTAVGPPSSGGSSPGTSSAPASTTNGTSTGVPSASTASPPPPPPAQPSAGTPSNAPDRPVGVTPSPTAINSGQTNATLPAISSTNAGSGAPNSTSGSPSAVNATGSVAASTPSPFQPTMIQPSLLGPVKPAGVWSLGPFVVSVGFSKDCFDKWFEKLSWFSGGNRLNKDN